MIRVAIPYALALVACLVFGAPGDELVQCGLVVLAFLLNRFEEQRGARRTLPPHHANERAVPGHQAARGAHARDAR